MLIIWPIIYIISTIFAKKKGKSIASGIKCLSLLAAVLWLVAEFTQGACTYAGYEDPSIVIIYTAAYVIAAPLTWYLLVYSWSWTDFFAK